MLTQLPTIRPGNGASPLLTHRRQVLRSRFQQGTIRQEGPTFFGYFTETRYDEYGREVRRRRCVRLGAVSDITEKQARRILQVDYLNAANSANHRKQDISIRAFIEKWKATVLPGMKPSTQSSVRSVIRQHIEPRFGEFRVSELDTETVQVFVSNCESACYLGPTNVANPAGGEIPRNSVGHALSPKTLRNIVITLRSIWRSAVVWKYAEADQVDWNAVLDTLPAYDPPEQRYFNQHEVKLILAASIEPFTTLYWMLWELGVRPGEVLALAASDIDLDGQLVHIHRSAWYRYIGTTKARRRKKWLEISTALTSHLRGFLANRKPDELAFHTANGGLLYLNDVVKDNLKPLLQSLGIPDGGAYAFRHGSGSRAAESASIQMVKERMGHANVETTSRYYLHTRDEAHAKLVEEMAAEVVPAECNGKVISPGSERVQ